MTIQAEHWKELVPGMTDSHVCGLDVSGAIATDSLRSLSVPCFSFALKLNPGVIDAVGEDVQGWTVGDAVLYHGDI
jgi:hypothetical protein